MRNSVLLLLALAGCTQYYYLDPPDIEVQPPGDLETRLSSFRSGAEPWHGDPKAVADSAIRRYVDVPWKADPFRPGEYEVLHREDWGTYVVRRYRKPSGSVTSYRVKLRSYKEQVWYPIQVSRFVEIALPDEDSHQH